MYKSFLLILISIFIAAGCTSVNIVSNKDTSYTKKLDRVIVTNNFGSNSQENPRLVAYARPLLPVIQGLSDKLAKRNVNAYSGAPLANADALKEAVATFNPNQILELNLKQYKSTRSGNHTYEDYSLELGIYDLSLRKIVWKSSVLVSYHFDLFIKIDLDKVTDDIMKKMESDGLLMPLVIKQADLAVKAAQ